MAVTFTVSYPFSPRLESCGSQRKATSRLTLTGSYDTGGFAVTPVDLGVNVYIENLKDVWVKIRERGGGLATVTGGYYDAATQKIKLNGNNGETTGGGSVTGLVLEVTSYV